MTVLCSIASGACSTWRLVHRCQVQSVVQQSLVPFRFLDNLRQTPPRSPKLQVAKSLINGQVDYLFSGEIVFGQYDGNSTNAQAILTKNRSPKTPNLAAAPEQKLTDFEVSGLFAPFLPTPTAVI